MGSKNPTPGRERGFAENLGNLRRDKSVPKGHPRVNSRQFLFRAAKLFMPSHIAKQCAAADDDPSLAAAAVRITVAWREQVFMGEELKRRAFVAVVARLLEIHTGHMAMMRKTA